MRRLSLARLLPLCALALLAAACGDDEPNTPLVGVVPDFTLTDVNPNSSQAGLAVSPRQYQQKVSAWYFGHAT